jgi:hypothetical protein
VVGAAAPAAATITREVDDRMTTQQQRADQRRQDKLAALQEQIDAGTLTVRRMTAKERARYPAKPRPERGRGSRRSYR